MSPRKLFDPAEKGRPMRVAGFLSGSGTNIRRLLEYERALDQGAGMAPYHVIFLFSDRSDGSCAGEAIALDYGIPYCSYDIRRYHKLKGIRRDVRAREGMEARRAYDQVALTLLKAFDIDIVALGGYMSYTTLPNCVNVHPADLSITDEQGKRKYVGDRAVYDAIRAGERFLRSSTLWTDAGVDTGPLLMLSESIPVDLPAPLDALDEAQLAGIAELHQERLKKEGDWKIFPRTIQLIAEGRMALDREGRLYVDGSPVEGGYREPCQVH